MCEFKLPNENLEIYKILYIIETGLREFIIDVLSSSFGPKWYKECLPGDILKKYRDGITYEKSVKWLENIPHHPIYYIDFPDISVIIEHTENWIKVFKPIFIRKDITATTLREIEPIRNKVAHNRKATEIDVKIMRSAYAKLSSLIVKPSLKDYANRCTYASNIIERIRELHNEAATLFDSCVNCCIISSFKNWIEINKEWWFDESYLGININPIFVFFEIISDYIKIPRHRGDGYKIKKWVQSNKIQEKYIELSNTFQLLLEV